MHQKDLAIRDILTAIESLHLPADQQNTAKDYITGTVNEEALQNLTFKNLSSIKPDIISETMRTLIETKHYDEARSLFNLLFTIGQSTCYMVMPPMAPNTYSRLCTKETFYRYIAINANIISATDYKITASKILEFEDNEIDLESLRKAIDCQRDTDNGKVLLLAVYFKRKYTDKITDSLTAAEKSNEASIEKALKRQQGIIPKLNKDSEQLKIEQDDLMLFKEYEDIIVNNLGEIFHRQTPPSTLAAIKKAVRGGSIDEVRQLIHDNASYTVHMMKLTGGMAYLNFPLSQILKNVVSLCLEINLVTMLNILDELSCRLNISITEIGGDFDTLFGFDSREYIIWAAVKDTESVKMEILKRKLVTDKDLYLSIVLEGLEGTKGMEAVNIMMRAAKVYAPELYQKLIEEKAKDGGKKDMEKIADLFVDRISEENKTTMREYLLGERIINDVYPLVDDVAAGNYYGEDNHNLIEDFRMNYGDGQFPRRCSILALFKKLGDYLLWEMTEFTDRGLRVDKTKVTRLFEGFEKENLTISYQLSVVDIVKEAITYEEDKTAFLDSAREVFENYLTDKRTETIDAITNATPYGRWFGLAVLTGKPQENKKEILSFAQDSSKPVKELLINTLREQREWEEDIKGLLSARKAGVRELGVRILLYWQEQGADYSDVFSAMLEKEKNAKLIILLQDSMLKHKGGINQ